jgi:hypothetical protein
MLVVYVRKPHLMSEILQWQTTTLSADFNGETRSFPFVWREVMDYFEEVLSDPALAPDSTLHSTIKTLHRGSHSTRMYDEPHTGTAWPEVEVCALVRAVSYTRSNRAVTAAGGCSRGR